MRLGQSCCRNSSAEKIGDVLRLIGAIASQTAKATEQIAGQVTAIQSATGDCVISTGAIRPNSSSGAI